MGESFGDTLKSKVGPAPVWAWVLLGVIGFAFWQFRKGASSSTSSSGAGASTGLPTEVVQGGSGMPYTIGGDTFVNVTNNIPPSGGGTTTPTPTPTGGGTKPKTPAPKPVHKPVKTSTHTYVVKHGDTLSGIARANHISLQTLLKMNPVYTTNPKYRGGNMIWSGDKVKLPGAPPVSKKRTTATAKK